MKTHSSHFRESIGIGYYSLMDYLCSGEESSAWNNSKNFVWWILAFTLMNPSVERASTSVPWSLHVFLNDCLHACIIGPEETILFLTCFLKAEGSCLELRLFDGLFLSRGMIMPLNVATDWIPILKEHYSNQC